ncbi:deoxyribodipyrimidine photo-lyase [Vibrio ostreicida]|uniref:Deoxyribodipyrimidine photo-lyase n=1 Tax=Vibrio ostreicida TaxID=526588 RepID=A0ABT8BY59_9VIBR|nr:deoxyribodipyrimidine photo-lyase [Vibrio ostreicida]MDN3612086.1 deoxyribodipyrimidine photo-lyase [Vibrio ostreicida]NPD08745.1 deoxyribodipyrimidine photo-lyase [Vibrio ostreicida]
MHLVWLRRDLRTLDNSALINAINAGQPVVCVFVATPQSWQEHGLAPIQADLIYRRLQVLQKELEALHIPFLYNEVDSFRESSDWVAELAVNLNAKKVWLNKEYEWNEQVRDQSLSEQLAKSGVEYTAIDDKCVLAPGTVLNQQGHYFKVFTPFKRAYLAKLDHAGFEVRKPTLVSPSQPLDYLGCMTVSEQIPFHYPRQSSAHYVIDTASIIQKLRDFEHHRVDQYDHHRDFPAMAGTSQLSPYLAIGALSVRQCLARLKQGQTSPFSQGREVWQSELVWREFYQHLIHFEAKLSKGRAFLEWGERLIWDNDPAKIQAWKRGQTGYPIVDAAMRQLNQTGWMHNRLRMIVASFLTKDLHVDWKVGERYFMSKLVDGDYAANNGGWQWCASTGCDGQPYFRIFNPTTQGERFDPDGRFVRKWVPELTPVPDKFIHQPWKWSGVKSLSYLAPIVDHKTEREVTLSHYKQAKGT